MNLVFILFDDLRPELSIYGRSHMITPNFERLSQRSVVFDKVFSQISVCNPSRDSLLTGLRPDSVGTYSFGTTFEPHLSLPRQLVMSNYSTASFGKIYHWEYNDPNYWSQEAFEGDWYGYQNYERDFMNSTVFPDKLTPEESFRDYNFTTKAIARLETMVQEYTDSSKKFMLAIGYKNPHLQLHVPYKYYDMYKNHEYAWKLTKKEAKFPLSVPDISYRCCAEGEFAHMENEGAKKNENKIGLGDINMVFNDKLRNELMRGYSASVTFVDRQLGRVLDVLDKHDLWRNTVVVLAADHGMHNGEKGIWEKWSLFDESTRVPLLIAHPDSPFHGQHYKHPVELIDIYPTVVDLLNLPFSKDKMCVQNGLTCHNLEGKSLAPVVMGSQQYAQMVSGNLNHKDNFNRKSDTDPPLYKLSPDTYHQNFPLSPMSDTIKYNYTNNASFIYDLMRTFYGNNYSRPNLHKRQRHHYPRNRHLQKSNSLQWAVKQFGRPSSNGNNARKRAHSRKTRTAVYDVNMPILEQKYAVSQLWRCAKKENVKATIDWYKRGAEGARPNSRWDDCDKNQPDLEDEINVMGYSLRTDDYRYTAWFHYNKRYCYPVLDVSPFEEELYDHVNETLEDFTHLETVNIAHRPKMEKVLVELRRQLIDYVYTVINFRGCFR